MTALWPRFNVVLDKSCVYYSARRLRRCSDFQVERGAMSCLINAD